MMNFSENIHENTSIFNTQNMGVGTILVERGVGLLADLF
jgi:ABC-type sulfate transport system substrate-binding protein